MGCAAVYVSYSSTSHGSLVARFVTTCTIVVYTAKHDTGTSVPKSNRLDGLLGFVPSPLDYLSNGVWLMLFEFDVAVNMVLLVL